MASSMPVLTTMGMALLVCVEGRPVRKVMLSLDVSLVTSFGGNHTISQESWF